MSIFGTRIQARIAALNATTESAASVTTPTSGARTERGGIGKRGAALFPPGPEFRCFLDFMLPPQSQ